MNISSISANSLSRADLYAYLVAAIAPRPIALVSSISKDGVVNLSPFSFFNVFGMNPPLLVFSPVRRGRDGSIKDTHQNVLDVPEVVINVVNYAMIEQMSLSSTAYAPHVNEFVKSGFSAVSSHKVSPPRVGESPVAFECIVKDVIATNEAGGAGNLVICEVVMLHIHNKYFDENAGLSPQKLDLVARMGGNWYCRANGNALFEVAKPLRSKGIGVDALPESVRNSVVLTGNNLGRLGNIAQIPSIEDMANIMQDLAVQNIITQYTVNTEARTIAIHKLAQDYLNNNQVTTALALLMAVN